MDAVSNKRPRGASSEKLQMGTFLCSAKIKFCFRMSLFWKVKESFINEEQ